MKRRTFLKSLAATSLTGAGVLQAAPVTTPDPIPIRTLGTGAADFNWSKYGEAGVRGSCSTLVDGRLLIDCGSTGYRAVRRFGVNPDAITDILFTHGHSDHCSPKEVRDLAAARSSEKPKLRLWGVAPVIQHASSLCADAVECHPVQIGVQTGICGFAVTPLPANHQLGLSHDPCEARLAAHYLIETPRGNLLYALDGAWMLKHARMLIGKKKLAAIIWDATLSTQNDDFRMFEHCNLHMLHLMTGQLKRTGSVDGKTQVSLSHMARTLWPKTEEAGRKLLPDPSWQIAQDGRTFTL